MTKATEIEHVNPDPLRASIPLPFHHVLFPYGFPVYVKANDITIIRAAELSWGSFRQRYRETPIEIRFIVSDVSSRRRPPVPSFRAQANLLVLVADAHNFGCCDLIAGFGFASVTKAAVSNRDYVRYHFLDAMVYTLLDARHLVAVHAACVAKDRRGVLFVGDSGAGKSSLAYACARRHWTYVSDDATALIRRKAGRAVLGNPQSFRFRPATAVLFPELRAPSKLRNGKPTIEIRTEDLPGIRTSDECVVQFVIFLNRLDCDVEVPSLVPVPRREALRRLSQDPWPTELLIQEERVQALERLLEAECLELTYRQFDPAIDLLETLVQRGKS